MATPEWLLGISFWLHMLATVVWLGSLAVVSMWLMPSMRQVLGAYDYADWLLKVDRRLSSIGWFSLALLVATGLVQMGANENYTGFFSFVNTWAIAILLKHLVIFGMIGVSGYITWGISPALQRAALRRAKDGDDDGEEKLGLRLQRMIALNLFLGVIVLAFTALARIA